MCLCLYGSLIQPTVQELISGIFAGNGADSALSSQTRLRNSQYCKLRFHDMPRDRLLNFALRHGEQNRALRVKDTNPDASAHMKPLNLTHVHGKKL